MFNDWNKISKELPLAYSWGMGLCTLFCVRDSLEA